MPRTPVSAHAAETHGAKRIARTRRAVDALNLIETEICGHAGARPRSAIALPPVESGR